MRFGRLTLLSWLVCGFSGQITGCGEVSPGVVTTKPVLRINEVVSNNEGVWVDERGEADDYVELYNAGEHAVDLSDYRLADSSGIYVLPKHVLAPGARLVFFADDSPEQGTLHLPFKLSASGEGLRLLQSDGVAVDAIQLPALAEHHAYLRIPDGSGSFVDCPWATPGRSNGTTCGPQMPEEPTPGATFAPFSLPERWPEPSGPLVLTEASLLPAKFVEILNASSQPIELDEFALRVAPRRLGMPWPEADAGVLLALPAGTLAPSARIVVSVEPDDLSEVAADLSFEGVLSVFKVAEGQLSDRVDFSFWPPGAVLARDESSSGRFRFCTQASEGAPNPSACSGLDSRTLGDHVPRLLTPGDFHELAAGRSSLGVEAVEFLIDLQAGGVVTFLNSRDWDLHYSFVREKIQHLPRLDRCDPEQRAEFNLGWYGFSETEYFRVEGRRFLLGNLVRHAGAELYTVDFSPGDVISAEQMKQAFFTVLQQVPEPGKWKIRPQTPDQLERVRSIEGQVPIVATDAPFQGLMFQPLAPGLAYGTLRFAHAGELESLAVGPRDIVITDQVPNDIPLIAGLITESFQTPLAHVNVLSRGRGTPNMALRNGREDPRVKPHLDRLIRLEVSGADFAISLADPAEALAFWESRAPGGEPLIPRLDPTQRGIVALEQCSLSDLPAIGGKAAQLSELLRVAFCSGPVSVPERPFAVPVVHYMEHFEGSGARALLSELRTDPRFAAEPRAQADGLARVRNLILAHPLDAGLHSEIAAAISERWPGRSLRFRSSSNVEDLAGFNGAGLYGSYRLDEQDVPSGMDEVVRRVWASLWNDRAYAERDYYSVDQAAVAMAVLVHAGFRSERANGVAVSRDVLDPRHADRYYVNAQVGEALVTNPAPGVESDEFTYQPGGWRPFVYHERSTFSPNVPVLTGTETAFLACNLSAIHQAFRPLLDPRSENPFFAMDIEFKLMGDERALVIKQARAFSFGREASTGWCDF